MRENPFPAEAERWRREHDSNVRALACDLRFKGGSVRPLPHPGKMEPRIGFEPMSSRLKGEHPGPLDERGGMERAARLELALSAWKADAQPICQARELAESAGVEPARPEGLVALAPRCLAARPTLLIGDPGKIRTCDRRFRKPMRSPLRYGTSSGAPSRIRTRVFHVRTVAPHPFEPSEQKIGGQTRN